MRDATDTSPGLTTRMFSNPQVILFTDDVERAVAFYCGLGFREVFRVPAEGRPIHADLEMDGYRIGFATLDSSRRDHGLTPATAGQRSTLTVWTADTRAAYADLVASGVPAHREPEVWLGRLLIAWVLDPDGNPVQLAQELSPGATSSGP
ncbi:glyoxalase/bleomycin resistance/dioxygenase family protein [Nakamurella sp. YIM 132087]|uniref:Glyoxalase/bleomycin resistance/dioxygenase family protein n=1 Tax=Nakamurella alba TaxID=2665158 RepID=A0A7K1FFL4_9ACTN|nr:VOC family protein [Nakamurella alba]MTD12898.1 glyoxalase/bleomycin resistance/dioxygenase family protein [Nakamurella alba]